MKIRSTSSSPASANTVAEQANAPTLPGPRVISRERPTGLLRPRPSYLAMPSKAQIDNQSPRGAGAQFALELPITNNRSRVIPDENKLSESNRLATPYMRYVSKSFGQPEVSFASNDAIPIPLRKRDDPADVVPRAEGSSEGVIKKNSIKEKIKGLFF
jgi:hypothetical protein